MKSKLKLIKTADVRDALDAYSREEISYGKMVEMLNDAANEAIKLLDVKDIITSFLKPMDMSVGIEKMIMGEAIFNLIIAYNEGIYNQSIHPEDDKRYHIAK